MISYDYLIVGVIEIVLLCFVKNDLTTIYGGNVLLWVAVPIVLFVSLSKNKVVKKASLTFCYLLLLLQALEYISFYENVSVTVSWQLIFGNLILLFLFCVIMSKVSLIPLIEDNHHSGNLLRRDIHEINNCIAILRKRICFANLFPSVTIIGIYFLPAAAGLEVLNSGGSLKIHNIPVLSLITGTILCVATVVSYYYTRSAYLMMVGGAFIKKEYRDIEKYKIKVVIVWFTMFVSALLLESKRMQWIYVIQMFIVMFFLICHFYGAQTCSNGEAETDDREFDTLNAFFCHWKFILVNVFISAIAQLVLIYCLHSRVYHR